ncbi:MAG: hypothetical protein LQ342_002165 [Letrouitia transgressa]|nr:MAG: hypothetical protein LQ342_002165 [Letrouitia transgressa]
MPQAKPKPSDIAAEAKRTFLPHIDRHHSDKPARSYFYPDSSKLRVSTASNPKRKLRVAVIDGDPVDVALDWHEYNVKNSGRETSPNATTSIPIVNMANEKRPGGDWESGLMAPEECLCRRSNLVPALKNIYSPNPHTSHYPIPTTGGLYSPQVDDGYVAWKNFKILPVISVAPIRRPKLDETGADYSFDQERDLMKEKMRNVLRIAAAHRHSDLCMGAFGVGPGFRNPAFQVASMWRDLLFSEREFQGAFTNVVFAVESAAGSTSKDGHTDYEIFKRMFDPSNIVKTSFRQSLETG